MPKWFQSKAGNPKTFNLKPRLLLRNSKKYALKQQAAFHSMEKKKSEFEK
jgi:hypothetical protein